MEQIDTVQHTSEEVLELMAIDARRNNQSPPSSPNKRTINIEEVKDVFRKRNYRRGFSIFDANKDGQIDVIELKRMISEMGNSVPSHVASRILNISDTNNDGYLDYQEFIKMVNNPQFSVLFGRYINTYVKTIVPNRKQTLSENVVTVSTLESGESESETDGSFEEQYSCWPPPITMVIISIIEIIFFAIDGFRYDATHGNGPMAMYLMYNPHKRYEAWRYLTYMFVHIGYMHLCVNLLVQIMLGIPLEMVHHGWRVMIVYLCGVIAGSLATSITDPYVYLAGASGGVYSLITAHISSVVMNWKEMTMPLIQLAIFLLITICDFGTAIYNRYFLQLEDHIGYEAHFAGAFAGLFVGIFILRNLEKNSCEKKLWWISLFMFSSFIIFAVSWNIFYPSYFPNQV